MSNFWQHSSFKNVYFYCWCDIVCPLTDDRNKNIPPLCSCHTFPHSQSDLWSQQQVKTLDCGTEIFFEDKKVQRNWVAWIWWTFLKPVWLFTNYFSCLHTWKNMCATTILFSLTWHAEQTSVPMCTVFSACGAVKFLQMLQQRLSLKSLEPIKIWRCYWPFIPKRTPEIMPCSKWKATDRVEFEQALAKLFFFSERRGFLTPWAWV